MAGFKTVATHTAGSPPPSQLFTLRNEQWQRVLTEVQPGWGLKGSMVRVSVILGNM